MHITLGPVVQPCHLPDLIALGPVVQPCHLPDFVSLGSVDYLHIAARRAKILYELYSVVLLARQTRPSGATDLMHITLKVFLLPLYFTMSNVPPYSGYTNYHINKHYSRSRQSA